MKKKILSILLSFLMIMTSISPVLAQSSDNYKVNWLVDNNYVKGYEDGSLKLANNITRAEFTKMVIAIEDLTSQVAGLKDKESKFSDVSLDHWANGYINLAVEKGYIKGYEDGSFRPEAKISYQEIITILDRLHPAFDEVSTSGKDWAKAYIDFAEKYDILKDVKIADFSEDAIREKAFELLYNLKHSPRTIAGERPEANKKTDTSSADWFWIYQYGGYRPADRGYRTVKFFVDGRLYNEQEVPYGEKLSLPSAPFMPGYTFLYWEANGEKFDPNTRIYGDLNLSPRFIKNSEPTPEPDPEPTPEPDPETPEVPVEFKVTYKFVSSDANIDLAAEVEALRPEAIEVEENTKVIPVAPTEKTIKTADGTWTFEGYTPEEVASIDKDTEFLGTWVFTAKPKEYKVTYNFESADGKELPAEVEALLPKATTAEENTSVTPIAPAKISVETAEGTWTFEGYTPEEVASIDKDTEFVGTWVFTAKPKEYKVTYKFESKDGKELPTEVIEQLPEAKTVEEKTKVTPVVPTEKTIETAEGTWTFEGYSPEEVASIDKDTEFVGTWVFTAKPKEYNVTYKFEAKDTSVELPKDVENLLPGDGIAVEKTSVTPVEPKVKTVTTDNGTWKFEGYTPTEVASIEADTEFLGTWTFEEKEVTISYVSSNEDMGTVSPASETLKAVTGTVKGSTATANANYIFVNWTDDSGKEVSKDLKYVPEKKAGIYTANFKEKEVTISYVSADSTMGTVNLASENVGLATGTIKGSTATANEGYKFVKWTDESGQVFTEQTLVPEEKEAKTYTAHFEEIKVKITYKVSDTDTEMGTVKTAEEEVGLATGTFQGSEAVANDGYVFVNWTDATGKVVSTDAKFQPTDKKEATYTANFGKIVMLELYDASNFQPVSGINPIATDYIVEKDSNGKYVTNMKADSERINSLIPKGYAPTKGQFSSINDYIIKEASGEIKILLFVDKLPDVTVTFDSVGGQPAPEKQSIRPGDLAKKPDKDPEKENYKFIEWTLDGKPFDFNSPVDRDIKLVAKFEIDETKVLEYKVKYFIREGKEFVEKTNLEETLTIPLANPVVKSVPNKAPKYYISSPKFPESTVLPFTVTAANNIIKIYYDYDANEVYNVTVNYFKDDILEKTENIKMLKANPIFKYQENKSGYAVDKTKSTPNLFEVKENGTVINVYYINEEIAQIKNTFKNLAEYNAKANGNAATKQGYANYRYTDEPLSVEIAFNPNLEDPTLFGARGTGLQTFLVRIISHAQNVNGTQASHPKLINVEVNGVILEKYKLDILAKFPSMDYNEKAKYKDDFDDLLKVLNTDIYNIMDSMQGNHRVIYNYELNDGSPYSREMTLKVTKDFKPAN